MLSRLTYAAATYTGLGLIGGLVYRELTRDKPPVITQLSVVHTHLLTLGTMVFLTALALEKLFHLSQHRQMTYFWWIYNAGLLLATTMMTVRGIKELDHSVDSKTMAGISGMGHILLTAGFVFLFMALIKSVRAHERQERRRLTEAAG